MGLEEAGDLGGKAYRLYMCTRLLFLRPQGDGERSSPTAFAEAALGWISPMVNRGRLPACEPVFAQGLDFALAKP